MKKTFIFLCIAVMTFCSLTAYAKPAYTKDYEWEVLKLTNDERTSAGLVPLSTFESLQSAAVIRSDETVELFSHTRPDGTSCFTVFDEKNIAYMSAAENIAAGQVSPQEVVSDWMNSEGHKENILSRGSKHLAVGYTQTGSGYRNYWSQLFVGGCSTTAIAVDGTVKSENGTLDYSDAVLKVTCNMHGDSHMPLENVQVEALSQERIKVSYDGKTTEAAVTVGNGSGQPSSPSDPTPEVPGGFTDVAQSAWYKKYVDYTVQNGIFKGTSATTFSPDRSITRAEFVQVLANITGVDTSDRNVTTAFSDVPTKKWYTPAVKWASENGVVKGVGNGKFEPNTNVTREQMCLMLVNYTKFKGITLKAAQNKASFADDAKISRWAKDAVYTCQAAAIVNGKGANTFDPQGTGTRAEAAAIFTRFHKDYLA